jgi:hypothetical protein
MPRLLETALNGPDLGKRLRAIEALGATPREYQPFVMGFLMPLIFDPDDEIVDAAIEVIGTLRPKFIRG